FLCYMSIIIAAVFTQHRDVAGSSMATSMNVLGIDPVHFVFERAALATLLLVLMAVDRTMERWRMQIEAATYPTHIQIATVPEIGATPKGAVGSSATQPDLERLLNAFMTMNQQNLQAMQAM